jgi:colanic acid biosynthesis glycosyl transferase WcaI
MSGSSAVLEAVQARSQPEGAPLRVTFFNRSYWPDTGATGQLLTELAEDLAAHHNVEVTVVTGYPLTGATMVCSSETRNGVSIVRASGTRFDKSRLSRRFANYLTYFASACLAAVRVPRSDVVVAMTDPPIIGLAALIAAIRTRARFVFLCEDIFPEVTTVLDFKSPTVNALLAVVNRFLIWRADAIIALGDKMKRRLVDEKGARPEKVSIIHNWADCGVLVPGSRRNLFSRAHGLDDRFVVMHSGNIGLSQNLDVMLEAAERLRDCTDIVFLLIGDGARKAALEQQARERGLGNVRFLPYQPRAEMIDSYATADLFVVSLKPGLAGYIVPSKLYSILASGRPYVAAIESDSEVAQITREFGCGIVVPPTDPVALADGILEVYRDRARGGQLGEAARRAGLTFDRHNQVAAYAGALRRIVEGEKAAHT